MLSWPISSYVTNWDLLASHDAGVTWSCEQTGTRNYFLVSATNMNPVGAQIVWNDVEAISNDCTPYNQYQVVGEVDPTTIPVVVTNVDGYYYYTPVFPDIQFRVVITRL